MTRASFRPLSRLPRLSPRWLAVGCALLGSIAQAGCAHSEGGVLPAAIVRGVAAEPPEHLPPPRVEEGPPSPYAPSPHAAPVVPQKLVPINLDTVLRLAAVQNGQLLIARGKLQEAFANKDQVAKAWLPDLWLGTTYYRHEGGNQNPDGTFVHSSFGSLFAGAELHGTLDLREAVYKKVDAERRIWQQRGEMSKLCSEQLLDASTTYIDLLSARAGEALSLQMESRLNDLLKRATDVAKIDPGMGLEEAGVQSEIAAQQGLLRKVREGSKSAGAKLAYLIGLDPGSELAVMDRSLATLDLVNIDVPVDNLIAQSHVTGPGIREVEGLLALITESQLKAQGMARFMPTLELVSREGVFGAGPGGSSTWDNRWDFVGTVKWNLTDLLTQKEKRRVIQAKRAQVELTYQDLRNKLALGIREAHEACQSGREQMDLAEKQMRFAKDAYDRSMERLINNVKGRSPMEVRTALRALGGAQLSYLIAIRDYDKAQMRLLVLVGGAGCHPDGCR